MSEVGDAAGGAAELSRARLRLGVGIAVFAVSVVFGLFGSVFGPFYSAVAGVTIVLVSVAIGLREVGWGRALLVIGVGVIVGALLYVTLGLARAGEPAWQTGCTTSTNEPCEP